MNSLTEYLTFCLKSTFLLLPNMNIKTLDPILYTAINQTTYDANEKYKNRLYIKDLNDLLTLLQQDSTIEAILFYRIERLMYLENPGDPLLPYMASLMKRRAQCEIYYSTEIGPGFNLQHGMGVVIGPRYMIGRNFTIHQGVTLGQKSINRPNEKIIIGDNVTLFANATIVGNIAIGNNVLVGANSVLLSDAESNSVYAGIPAKKVANNMP